MIATIDNLDPRRYPMMHACSPNLAAFATIDDLTHHVEWLLDKWGDVMHPVVLCDNKPAPGHTRVLRFGLDAEVVTCIGCLTVPCQVPG